MAWMFEKISKERLATAHKDLQIFVEEWVKEDDLVCAEGHRGEKAQNEAFANGFSKYKFPEGKHNKKPSDAVDLYPRNFKKWNIKKDETGTSESVRNWTAFCKRGQAIADKLYAEGKLKKKIRNKGLACGWDYPHWERY